MMEGAILDLLQPKRCAMQTQEKKGKKSEFGSDLTAMRNSSEWRSVCASVGALRL
jgi:hypothetical protein